MKDPFDVRLPSISLPDFSTVIPKITLPQLPQFGLPPKLLATLGRITKNPMIELVQSISAAAERMNRELATLGPNAKALGERGWTIPMLADIPFMRSMIEEASADRLDAAFLRYYAADGGRLTQQLFKDLTDAKDLEHWRPLLKQAMASYKRRQYQLVVPSLLLTFEGAIAKTAGALDRKSAPRAAASRKRSEARGFVRRLIWLSLEGFINEVFREHHFGGSRPLRVNRHWIMHGRDKPDWNRADCLRLFQAIHTLTV